MHSSTDDIVLEVTNTLKQYNSQQVPWVILLRAYGDSQHWDHPDEQVLSYLPVHMPQGSTFSVAPFKATLQCIYA